MPTWAQYQAAAETRAKRAVQDRFLRRKQREFDLSAQDQHAKSERLHFAVVGEGSASAQANYRLGYERIFASRRVGHGAVHTAPASSPGCSGAGVTG